MCKCGRERRRRNNNGKNANEGCRREEGRRFICEVRESLSLTFSVINFELLGEFR